MKRSVRGSSLSILAAVLVSAWAAQAPADARPNHLAGQTSPYLLQHVENPVDWYPWGEEAFRKARQEDRPVFLSIGYSACHWCHVMERGAFSDPGVARFLNQHFVSIKVDREERPDLDALYMSAVLAMTGRGGWPMTVFLTPERKPFFGGTFFATEGFQKLIESISEGWTNRRQEVLSSASAIASMLEDLQHAEPSSRPGGPAPDPLPQAVAAWTTSFDRVNGGFGSAPKFPPHGALLVLLESYRTTGDARALDIVTRTLDAMDRGGIHDQIGGGFHRYSTDEKWLQPHFEKMLYDNALLVPVYLEAWKAGGGEEFRRVAEETIGWATRDLADPRGGFYATLDADSDGEEGRYYVWTRTEIEDAVGAPDGALVADYFGATATGNLGGGRNILNVPDPPGEFAARHGLEPAALAGKVERARVRLLQARGRRPAPRRDDKILAGWNGLMISACARAYSMTGNDAYRQAGERAARFVLGNLLKDGVLRVSWRQGKVGPPGFLDDHAFLARGLLDLYDATGRVVYRDEAARPVRSSE